MTPKKLPSSVAHEMSEFIKRKNREMVAKYKVPPSILGKPDKRKKPSWKKVEKMLFDVLEQAHGKKLFKYQKDFIRAIWKHQEAVSELK